MEEIGSARLLRGLRVLDLTQFTPGPYCTLLLSDLGADVLKIEPPAGDPMRVDGPIDADGIAAWYKVMNRNKRVLRIDLKSDAGRAAFAGLVAAADVLLESYRPGVLERLGFPDARLDEINPRLVHCALSGFGRTGPYRLRPGHDITYMAFGGGLIQSGTEETPVVTGPTVADFAGSLVAGLTIVSALNARDRDGHGAHIDVGLADAVLGWLGPELTALFRAGFEPRRAANAYNGGLACYQVYRTSDDRFIALGIVEEKFWRTFCEAVARPDWLARQWEPLPQHALIGELAALFRSRTRDAWQDLLDPLDTCFHVVLDLPELLDHPQALARRLIRKSADAEPLVDVLLPAWIDGRPPEGRRPWREITLAEAVEAWSAHGM
ncbi:MAG: CoA transferase [Hyphomicrobiaceae bacterium]